MIMRNIGFIGICSIGILSGCSGGGGGGGGPTAAGFVLDGTVESSRVCYDLNFDSQCTSVDNYVTTDSTGRFEIVKQDGYQLIADIRHAEATDIDYSSGSPDYDYVLQAYDQDTDEIVISPLSTYMNYQKTIRGEPEQNIAANVVAEIQGYEQFQYAQEVEVSYDYSEIIQGNYISGESSEDAHLADFNSRLHNINEVLAREMQESQAIWEDRFNSGELTIDSTEWSDISDTIVTNSYGTTFESFEILVEEVTSYDFTNFNASDVSDTIWMDVPDIGNIQTLIDFIRTNETIAGEFSGSTYRHSISTDFNEGLDFGYYVLSANAFSYYFESNSFDERNCVFASAPFPGGLSGMTEAEFVSSLNNAFAQTNASDVGITYSPLERVDSPPSHCSSLSDLLEEFSIATDLALAEENQIFETQGRRFSENDPCFQLGNLCDGDPFAGATILTQSSSAVVSTTGTLSNGGTSAGTLNTCVQPGVINSCRTSRKD